MADEHAGGGGNQFIFLFLLAGAMLAAVAFKAVHTGIPLTTMLKEKINGTAAVSSAPAVSNTAAAPAVSHEKPTPTASLRTQKPAAAKEHWTTITLDENNEVISVTHY